MKLFLITLIGIFLIILLFLYIYRIIVYENNLEQSIILFLKKINDFIIDNDFIEDRSIKFKRFIIYNNQRILLGNILFDNIHRKIIIYETFVYKKTKLLCLPDIRIFSYNEIDSCKIYFNNKIITSFEFDLLLSDSKYNEKNYKNLLMKIYLKKDNEIINLKYSSINNIQTMKDIYESINEIISNKKIV